MKVKIEGTYLTPDQRRQFYGQKKSTRRPGQVQGQERSFKNILSAILHKK